jgi:hypothetical protein
MMMMMMMHPKHLKHCGVIAALQAGPAGFG